jgi:hypothetical protein
MRITPPVLLDWRGDFASISKAIDTDPINHDRTTMIYFKRRLINTKKLI